MQRETKPICTQGGSKRVHPCPARRRDGPGWERLGAAPWPRDAELRIVEAQK